MTTKTMDTDTSMLKGEGKSEGRSERLSLLVLGICIATLVAILVVRPF
jgi:hypothetical protein